jgi:transcriptional regulator with XRE-family HTH domain
VSERLHSKQAARWRRDFGDRVRTIRTDRGLSQEALADAAHVHRTYVGAVERGEQNISLVLIHYIAGALDVAPSRLFE